MFCKCFTNIFAPLTKVKLEGFKNSSEFFFPIFTHFSLLSLYLIQFTLYSIFIFLLQLRMGRNEMLPYAVPSSLGPFWIHFSIQPNQHLPRSEPPSAPQSPLMPSPSLTDRGVANAGKNGILAFSTASIYLWFQVREIGQSFNTCHHPIDQWTSLDHQTRRFTHI